MKILVAQAAIEKRIFLIRNHRVMLDRDLAGLYGVTTGNLNKSVKRSIERFPEDFLSGRVNHPNGRYCFHA